MERWKPVNTEARCSIPDDAEELESNKHGSNLQMGNEMQFVPENELRQLNGDIRIYQDASCRPKFSFNGSVGNVEVNFNLLNRHTNHCHNGFSPSHYHDCHESQYLLVPTVESQCFCPIQQNLNSKSKNELAKGKRNIDSHICHTVVCDGMESYFNENAAVISDIDSNKLLNGTSVEKSKQNNLNSEAKVNGSIVGGCDNNQVPGNLDKLQNLSKSGASISLPCELHPDEKSIECNGRLCEKSCSYSIAKENERQLPSANIICDAYDDSSAPNDCAQEMDYIALDVNPVEINDGNQNAPIDSDIGSDSGGSSPQPSSYDSGNDNEEVNIDCLTETNSVNEDEENNDLGNNLHSEIIENECRTTPSISFQNQLSPNIVAKPPFRDVSNVQNVFVDEHSLCSDDSDHVNMDICENRTVRKESSFNIQSEDMECDDLNFHFTLKKVVDKNNIFSAKTNHVEQNNHEGGSRFKKEMDTSNYEYSEMIWSEKEARNHIPQIGTSSCGAIAVNNVMLALKIPFSKEKLVAAVKTKFRAENAPLAEYLLSRSVAGTTHHDLISAVHDLTEGKVYGRFFHLYPVKRVQLMKWIADFIRIGAVPIATLNLQQGVSPGEPIPDAWHHQMVFGVGPNGLYMTNPLMCVSPTVLSKQLCSESVLLVKRSDIIHRWNENGSDLSPIMINSDPRWLNKNVIGQVVNVLREAASAPSISHRRTLTHHITIPAAYQSGITFFIRKDSKGYRQLLHHQELS